MLAHERLMLRRRDWLAIAAGTLACWTPAYGFAGQNFWDKKDPDQWSADEIRKLLNKSPWAKEVTAEKTTSAKKSVTPLDPSVGMPRPKKQSRTDFPKPQQGPREKTVTTYRGTVLWESAAPVRAVDKTPLPQEFAGMYVLSVGGLALGSSMERLRQGATLAAKGHDPLEAAVAKHLAVNGDVFLFGFARQALEISKDDKEVLFESHMNKMRFAAKFNPREMVYRGELAV